MLLGLRAALGFAVTLSVVSCRENPRAAPLKQSAGDAPASARVSRAIDWDSAFGSLIAYSVGDSTVVALLPSFQDARLGDTTFDASGANGLKVDLFGSTGLVESRVALTNLGKASYEEGCFEFSRGHLIAAPSQPWSIGLPAGRAKALPVTRLSSLRAEDSSSFADRIRSLGTLIPPTRDSIWRTTPFMIDDGVRVTLPDAIVVAASVTQILPGDEHWAQSFFFVAEHSGTDSAGDSDWSLAYVHPNRSDSTASGLDREDQVGVAGGVTTISDSRPVLLLETRGNEVNGYAALGRVSPGHWRVVWSGPHEGGC